MVRTQRLKDVIVTITDPSENPASVVHDPGTIVSSTQTIYNTKGQVARSIAADGQVTDSEYDPLGRQTATIGHPVPAESVGLAQHAGYLVRHRTEILYDTQGRVATQLANIVQVETAAGALIAIDRTAVQSTSYTYDAFGNRTTTTFSDGSHIQVRYDDFGRQVAEMQQTEALYIVGWSDTANSFVVTGWDADQDGQPDATQPPDTLDVGAPIPTKLLEYDSQGQLVAVLLPAVPDPQNDNQLTRPRYEYGYDAQGNHVLIRDPLGRETWLTYGPGGEQLTRTLPLGFGPDGILGTEDDAELPEGDFTEEFRYDDQQRQVLHISFEGVVAQSIYDPATGRRAETLFFDNLTQYASGNGQPGEVWIYKFDAFGREVQVTQHDGTASRTVHKTYDAQGRLVPVRSDEGVITYAYDALGRKSEMQVFPAGADPDTDPPERVTSYAYDGLGRLKTVIETLRPGDPNIVPLATVYTYNILGNLARTDLPNGVITVYAYDALNRLRELIHYEPEAVGLLDPDNLDPDMSDNQPLARFVYTVRADGKRTSATETFWLDADSNPATPPTPHVNRIDWTYDDIGRLTDEVFNHFDDELDQIERFVYDLVGNRLEKWLNTDPQFDANGVPTDTIADELVAWLYDANDRLLESKRYTAPEPPDPHTPAWTAQDGTHVQTTTYAYAQTQQTAKVVKGANHQITSKLLFDYDLQGRLWKATTETYTDGNLTSRERVTYDYDATGIRVSALQETDPNLDGQYQPVRRTAFLVDHHNFTGYQQVIKETTYDAQGEISKTIEYTIGLDEIAQTVTPYVDGEPDPENAQTHIFAHDGHGSVRVLFDLSAAVAQLYAFDAYGQLTGIHDATAELVSQDASDALTTVLYSGEQFDAKLAMQYLRARYYDPATGRFNRLDPFFGNLNDPLSLHKYLYVHGDPIQGADPTGLMLGGSLGGLMSTMAIGGIIGGGIGGIDAALGGEGWGGILAGVGVGFAFGVAAGALVYAFPSVMMSGFVFGFNLGFSLPFIADSFEQGKDAQGYFRIFTGIAVPIAVRNAAVARLLAVSRAAAIQRLTSLWRVVALRANSYGFEPGITGSYVNQRIPISRNVRPGRYLYVVDADGKMWLAPIDAQVAGIDIKHSSLVPPGEPVRAAGHLVVKPNRTVNLNSDSGHYMRDRPILPNEEPAWLEAMAATLLDAEVAPGALSPMSGLIPD